MQIREFYGGEGGIPPLVPALGAGAINGLLEGVGRQYAKDHRELRFERDSRQSGAHRTGDIFEVRRLSANDAPETDHRVTGSAFCELLRELGNFERPGAMHDPDRVLRRPVAPEAIERSIEEPLGHKIVKPAYNNAEGIGSCVELSLNNSCHNW